MFYIYSFLALKQNYRMLVFYSNIKYSWEVALDRILINKIEDVNQIIHGRRVVSTSHGSKWRKHHVPMV